MPGMRKAARRAKLKRAHAKPLSTDFVRAPHCEFYEAPVAFARRLVETIVVGKGHTGLPEVRAAYRCSLDDYCRYQSLLQGATQVLLRVAEGLVAVDLMQGDAPLGRIMTNFADDRLHEIVAAVEAGANQVCVSLHHDTIGEPTEESEAAARHLPVSLEPVSVAELCGEPKIEGAGPVVGTTIDVVTANHTLRRFRSLEEAEAHGTGNKEAGNEEGSSSGTPIPQIPTLWEDLLLFDELMRNTTMTDLGGGTYSVTMEFPRSRAA